MSANDPWSGTEPASTTPQDTVERALAAASRGSETIVIADESSTANLRWAGNTLTTNGVAATRSLTVISVDRRADGTAGVGMVARSGVTPGQVEDIVREAEKAAAEASSAEDAADLVTGAAGHRSGDSSWSAPASGTDFGVFRSFAAQLGETLRGAEAAGRKLYGFAEHGVTATFLGTSAGVRARYDQPTGRLELNAKSADQSRSAWAGVATRDFTDVDVAALDAGLAQRLGWQSRRLELPAGRYETLLPPTAVSDMLIYQYWSAGARDAAEGRTVFSRSGGGTRVGDASVRDAARPVQRPAVPGGRVRAVRGGARLRPGLLRLRQRPAVAARVLAVRRRAVRAAQQPLLGAAAPACPWRRPWTT